MYINNTKSLVKAIDNEGDLVYQHSLLKAQQEACPDGVLVVSNLGETLYSNKHFSDLWGIPPEIVSLKSDEMTLVWVLDQLASPEIFLRRIDQLYAHPAEKSFDEVHLRDQRTFERYSSPAIGENKEIIGRIWFFRDISQRKNVEKQVIEQQKLIAAASRMSSLGEIAAGIAHEINGPLGIIQLLNDQLRMLAQEGPVENTVIFDIAEKVESTIDRIIKIVRSLRVLSRDTSKEGFENATVKSLIDNTLGFCSHTIHKKCIQIEVSDIPEDLVLRCHPVQISQVLLNLIINAVQAVEMLPEKWIKIIVSANDEKIKIEIIDSGLGIPLALQSQMFHSFFTTKSAGVGTGLGLSISKNIVDLHGGTLSIDKENPNTSFVIVLPRKPIAIG